MTAYTARFKGRLVGAIGVMSYFNVDIEADNEEEARAKLYDTHEHITGLFWLWDGKQTVCEQPDHSLARKEKGMTHYVSTYTTGGWIQTDCKAHEIEQVKTDHLVSLGLN